MNLLLPRDGSIVVIDDKYNEAKPLLDILSKNGYPSIYFDGDLESLPKDSKKNPTSLNRVRVVFADIQLKPALSDEQYINLITTHLSVLISEKNGPYILVVWSAKEAQLTDRLKEVIDADAFERKPIAFIRLNKTDYFKTKERDDVDYSSFIEAIESRFTEDDITFIVKEIDDNLINNEQTFTCSSSALKRISLKIKTELRNYQAFELLIKWESLVHLAATNLTSEFSKLHIAGTNWDFNIRNIISRLAQAQVGSFLGNLDSKDFIRASFKTLNTAFHDYLDSEVFTSLDIVPTDLEYYRKSGYAKTIDGIEYKVLWNNYEHFELYIDDMKKGGNHKSIDKIVSIANTDIPLKTTLTSLVTEYSNINPALNTKLNIDLKTKSPFQPGVVYEISLESERKRIFLDQTYFKDKYTVKLEDGSYKITEADLEKIKFIELEVSPNCDFANNKWVKHRTISGIIMPDGMYNSNKVQSGDSLYLNFPLIKFNGQIVKILFSFKLLKSYDISKGKRRSKNFCFKIKEQPMADIITRMTSHASRIGIIEFK